MTYPQTRRAGELVFALALVIFSAVAFWQSYAISGFSGLSEPGVFPMLASATMLMSAVLILKSTGALSKPQGPRSETGLFFSDVVSVRLIAVVALILTYVIAMPYLGFVLSSAFFLFVSFWFLWRKPPLASAILTAGSLAAIYFIFRVVFQVVLPRGSLFRGTFLQIWF